MFTAVSSTARFCSKKSTVLSSVGSRLKAFRSFSVMQNDEEGVTVLEDNPCWGTSTRHRLQDLLALIERETSIIYDSPQYLVLNKPPDLRMDGPYAATVHKLLTYWYPPPSLSVEKQENEKLLKAVARLHQYNDVRDNFLRPCHQLDYATSGVLLVAKTQEAAGHISRLFEERHEGVQKSYMAIVVGDMRKNLLNTTKIPIWTEGTSMREVREQMQRMEETYRRSRTAAAKQHCRERDAKNGKNQNKKSSLTGGTFDGFQPAHSLFVKWKSKVKSKACTADESSPPKKKQKRKKKNSAGDLLTDDDWKRIWKPVQKVVDENCAEGAEKLAWKQLHEKHHSLKQALVKAADIHNDILRSAIKEKEQKLQEEKIVGGSNGKDLPMMFRLSEKIATESNGDSDNCTFYICCPLAQHPDQFNMVIPTKMGKGFPDLTTPNTDDETNGRLKFRPSLTKCTVLESGTISIHRDNKETQIDVTKVRLFPMTGRRHQLRVHMALAGFPILGDVAYGGDRYVRQKEDDEQEAEFDICSRMCLHARSLQLPTIIGESQPNWKIETPDPFVIGSDGTLKLT